MRASYGLSDFFNALSAWQKHEKEYLSALENARQPKPDPVMLENYQRIWIEGYLEARSDYAESKSAS